MVNVNPTTIKLAVSASFENLCYGSTAIINSVILSVWGSSLGLYVRSTDVRF